MVTVVPTRYMAVVPTLFIGKFLKMKIAQEHLIHMLLT